MHKVLDLLTSDIPTNAKYKLKSAETPDGIKTEFTTQLLFYYQS